ncbi:MAG: phenylalanine--tRNA ligase subunit beta [Leptospiraceae bacterium]|nr:phenylalanine--tRNA ligase subunit beta [Leptospiraceae bacterium]
MKLSLNWINQYIKVDDIPQEELVRRLTLATCEVEEVLQPFADLKDLIVARIESLEKHPDADKLNVCQVFDGKSTLQVICGASNVRSGIHVLFAPIGAVIGDPENPLKIEKRKIRGVESSGMICAPAEVGLEMVFPDREGILILDDEELLLEKGNVSPARFLGLPVSKLLPITDTVLDIDNKSITHRPDLWCHFGFAREIAAIYRRKIIYNPLESAAPKAKKGIPSVKIEIRNQAALGYSGLAARGIHVGPSPLWLRARLASVGQKSINSIVDASNLVMLELAQPNHAFDLSRLDCELIAIDKCRKPQKVDTLDDATTEVPENSVLILAEKGKKSRAVAVGGIIGGSETAISSGTTEIFLESATFPRELIRRTLSRLPLRTDSAVRFEKGQDPAKMIPALYRLAGIIQQLCPEAEFGSLAKAGDTSGKRNRIKTDLDFLQRRLGFAISEKEVMDTLEWLGFEAKSSGGAASARIKGSGKGGGDNSSATGKKSAGKTLAARKKAPSGAKSLSIAAPGTAASFEFIAPTYRSQYDISIPEDIIEELGRIYGYDNIPEKGPSPELRAIPANEVRNLERFTKSSFQAQGFYETMGYSFCSEKENQPFGNEGLKILNPVNAVQGRMRLSQIPGILKQAALNQNRFDSVRLMELGRVFLPPEEFVKNPEKNLPRENSRITCLALPDEERSRADNPAFEEFLHLRTFLERFLTGLNLNYELLIPIEKVFYLHPGCQIEIRLSGDSKPKDTGPGHENGASSEAEAAGPHLLGYGGMIHPAYGQEFELKRSGVLFDLDFDILQRQAALASRASYYRPPGNQPDSLFEFTVVLNESDSTARPVQIIRFLEIPEIQDISLKTIYRGAPLQSEEMAVSYKVRASRRNETLSGKDSQAILDRIIEALKAEGIPLRA